MPHSAGDKLAAYEIVSLLGAGRTGQVYRGRDTKLGREVAIKVLAEDVSRDEERLVRFERGLCPVVSRPRWRVAGVDRVQDAGAKVRKLGEGKYADIFALRGDVLRHISLL